MHIRFSKYDFAIYKSFIFIHSVLPHIQAPREASAQQYGVNTPRSIRTKLGHEEMQKVENQSVRDDHKSPLLNRQVMLTNDISVLPVGARAVSQHAGGGCQQQQY